MSLLPEVASCPPQTDFLMLAVCGCVTEYLLPSIDDPYIQSQR